MKKKAVRFAIDVPLMEIEVSPEKKHPLSSIVHISGNKITLVVKCTSQDLGMSHVMEKELMTIKRYNLKCFRSNLTYSLSISHQSQAATSPYSPPPPHPSNCLCEAIVGSSVTPCDSDDETEVGVEVTVVFPSSETILRCVVEFPAITTVTLSLSSPEDLFPLLRSVIFHLEGLLCCVDAPAAVRTVVALLLFPSESLLPSRLPSYPVVAPPLPSVISDVAVVQ
ncbi:unnamed protein product [Lactuca saligna]|uniref:Uncharacterized protein n=1 Tax=Lactuca saligna TaxID=75948 RepID=A0AA35Y8G0_LACSI|nr:unnamed protein product [Lactuca saligna]